MMAVPQTPEAGDDGHGRDSRGLSARPWLMEGRFKDRDSDDSDDSDRHFVVAGGSVPGPPMADGRAVTVTVTGAPVRHGVRGYSICGYRILVSDPRGGVLTCRIRGRPCHDCH
jgi:hypothetical protein